MENKDTPHPSDTVQNPMAQINRALGLFICFFGIVVLISIMFTETFMGQMTNLGAGLLLTAIGVIMIYRAKVSASKP